MEYCGGGDLSLLIKQKRKKKDYFTESQIWKVFTQVCKALHECHTRPAGKIIHRDLKPGNIFLDGDSNVKLGDFGLSRILSDKSMYAQTNVGTPYYMSPEMVKEKKYDEKTDIWSVGCLLYEMAALVPPFKANNFFALANKIQNGEYDKLPDRYSSSLQQLIDAMIQVDSDKRPSVQQMLDIPQIK